MSARLSYLFLILSVFITACGGGGNAGIPSESDPVEPEVVYSVGGIVSGLSGTGLSVQINNGEILSISGNESFEFQTKLNTESSYSVAVITQPTEPTQLCTVSTGDGVISDADVTNISIECINAQTVSGTVSGLSIGTSLSLQINSGEIIPVLENGNFSFTRAVAVGSTYEVLMYRYPTSPVQTCIVSNGSGTITGSDITDISVSCTTPGTSYTFGGSVTGLINSSLVLTNNTTGEELPMMNNGAFTFNQPLGDGSRYSVTILTRPTSPSHTCTVTNGEGILSGANITNISVDCVVNNFSVGGNVTGLVGEGLVLSNYFNSFTDPLSISTNGEFVFSPAYRDALQYRVEVATQPTNPKQTCTVVNGSGILEEADIKNVEVNCVTDTFTVGGNSSGLMGSMTLSNNKGGSITIDQPGSFTFDEGFIQGEDYLIQIASQPVNPAQTCTIDRTEGTVALSNITNISLTCNLTWDWANPKPQGNPLNDIVWSGSQYVTVGDMGAILTSTDGTNWIQRESGVEQHAYGRDLTAISWNGTRFVAVGGQGARVTSTDGINWTDASNGTSSSFVSINWNGSQFLSFWVGFSMSYPTTSTDGSTWTDTFDTGLSGVRVNASSWGGPDGDNKYVVVGSVPATVNGSIATSTNGLNWTVISTTVSGFLRDVVWMGSQFVAVGRNGLYMTSPNGVEWTTQTSFTTNTIQSITWNGSELVANDGWQMYTSATGASDSWTAHAVYTDQSLLMRNATRINNQYFAVGAGGGIFSSSTGSAWSSHHNIISLENLNDATWSGSRTVVVGNNGTILSSVDNINWQVPESGVSAVLNGVVYAENMFVAVGDGGTVITSSNGIDWTTRESKTTNTLNEVISNGTSFMAVGASGTVITSPDGISWTASTTGETIELKDVVWGGSQYIAVGPAAIYTKADGGAWQRQAAPTTVGDITTIAWTGSQYVAASYAGSSSSILTSDDGIAWTDPTYVTSGRISDLIWDGLHLIGAQNIRIGTNPKVYFHFSKDGINWSRQFTPSSFAIRGVVSTNSQYIIIGYGGQILRSLK